MLGCWASQVDRAAETTLLIDQQFAVMYEAQNYRCTTRSENWDEYDECMDPWKGWAAAVARLREVTLNLDVAKGRKAKKVAACEWFRAVTKIHPLVPARKVALASQWRQAC